MFMSSVLSSGSPSAILKNGDGRYCKVAMWIFVFLMHVRMRKKAKSCNARLSFFPLTIFTVFLIYSSLSSHKQHWKCLLFPPLTLKFIFSFPLPLSRLHLHICQNKLVSFNTSLMLCSFLFPILLNLCVSFQISFHHCFFKFTGCSLLQHLVVTPIQCISLHVSDF